ncbi:MAG: hypothetical protein H5U10_03650 [Desulfacinum sp.]|nr:hypothetical protein [Desulfacinum sp.]
MRRAFLIVGFNNWGKTTLVYDLFRKQRFLVGYGYRLQPDVGRRFTVESHSNDDVGDDRYITLINRRVSAAPPDAQDLISVLCPSRETTNDACRILGSPAFQLFDEIHLLLLRYKWDLHAELHIKDIEAYFGRCGNPRLRLHVIDEGVGGSDQERGQRRCSLAHDIIRSVLGE